MLMSCSRLGTLGGVMSRHRSLKFSAKKPLSLAKNLLCILMHKQTSNLMVLVL
jgi:hypothetical protein